jgi:CHASE2 domain-containing sensor protein
MQFIREHLADLPRLVWWRFVKFWHLYPFTHGFPENVGFGFYVAVTLLAVAGTWLTRREWRRTGFPLAVVACFAASVLLFWGGFRMRTPAEPALIVLAAGAVTRILSAHRSSA